MVKSIGRGAWEDKDNAALLALLTVRSLVGFRLLGIPKIALTSTGKKCCQIMSAFHSPVSSPMRMQTCES